MSDVKYGNCKYFYTIGEWSYPQCSIAKVKNDETILILGKKGTCPYHEYSESYGWK